MTFQPQQVAELRAHVWEQNGEILGFFTIGGIAPEGELDHLYVYPEAMRRGLGKALLAKAREVARSAGFRALNIHSDPNAEKFYLMHGAIRVGDVPSGSIPGRRLPLLRIDL